MNAVPSAKALIRSHRREQIMGATKGGKIRMILGAHD